AGRASRRSLGGPLSSALAADAGTDRPVRHASRISTQLDAARHPVVMGARATQLRSSSSSCTIAKMNEAPFEYDANDRHAHSHDVGNGPHLAPRHHLPASGNRGVHQVSTLLAWAD